MELAKLKKEYDGLAAKYKLPSFKELNEDFEIERIDKESECLLHMVRKTMMDKVANAMTFLDMLLNPMNAPRVYLMHIKSMSSDDKKEIDGLYSSLSELVMSALTLEIEYSESGEAEMIKRIVAKWGEVKPGFKRIIENLSKPVSSEKKERTYYG